MRNVLLRGLAAGSLRYLLAAALVVVMAFAVLSVAFVAVDNIANARDGPILTTSTVLVPDQAVQSEIIDFGTSENVSTTIDGTLAVASNDVMEVTTAPGGSRSLVDVSVPGNSSVSAANGSDQVAFLIQPQALALVLLSAFMSLVLLVNVVSPNLASSTFYQFRGMGHRLTQARL